MAPLEGRERELRRSNLALGYQSNKLESKVYDFTQMVYVLAVARLTLAAAVADAACMLEDLGQCAAIESFAIVSLGKLR